eukprot:TRINITY_DN10489_c0_g7_i1.p1 TRINITY_DN10489_c0_g7~~TRINITY_DN10489_c0_g7_i1.p1  ORF type:complete len:423 (+),score=67.32 TRINITY_DN10489_c0_g7_i1:102-1370(+)
MQTFSTMARLYLPQSTARAWAPVILCLALVVILLYASTRLSLLACFLLFLSRPNPSTFPADDNDSAGSFFKSVSAWFGSGDDKPQIVDMYLFRVASYRDRAFIGLACHWIEIPRAWWSLLDKCAIAVVPSEVAGCHSDDPVVARATAEAEARRLKQQCSYARAAEAYGDLEASNLGKNENLVQLQRNAEEAGRCWTVAGKPDKASPHLRRAIQTAVDCHGRQSAAEALAKAAVEMARTGSTSDSSKVKAVISEALQSLFAVATAEPCRFQAAARSAASYVEQVAECFIRRFEFREAASILDAALDCVVEAVDGCELDELTWLVDLETCMLWRFLCTIRRDAGDAFVAGSDVEATLRQLPPLLRTRGSAFALDVSRAAEDSDVESLESICSDFDARCGSSGMADWQLDVLLQLKERIASADLS